MRTKDLALFYGNNTKVKAYYNKLGYFLSIETNNRQTLLEFDNLDILKNEFKLFTENL